MLCCDGDRVELTDDGVRLVGSVGGDHLYVDGSVGDLGSTVLSERRKLGADGFVAVVMDIDLERGAVVRGPEVVSRGWVEHPALLAHESAVADAVEAKVRDALADGRRDLKALRELVLHTARRTSRERTRRRPVIVPLVYGY